MVTLGTTLSVTWILVANSWMQTPAGYKQVNGLTYNNSRPDYLKAWWDVMNWDKIAERYASAG